MAAGILPAIIGGSGLETMPALDILKRLDVTTPWGQPSTSVVRGRVHGADILFLSRHGAGHLIPPHRINYRANVAALQELGATHLIAFNAVGGINQRFVPGDLVLPDQIIDYTWGREHTFADSGEVPLLHVDFTYPYDRDLRQLLINAAGASNCQLHANGVYGATQGPRLESAAEIVRLARDGCDLVGMTGMPEAALAREKQLPYVSLCLVVNPAAGLGDGEISMADIDAVMAAHMPRAMALLSAACVRLTRQH